MKKIEDKPFGKSYQSVRLFREDLEDILNLLSENAEKVMISDDEYSYDSFEEFKNKRGVNPKRLSINSYNPMVSLRFKREGPTPIFLYRDNSDQKSVFLCDSIEKVLQKRQILLFKILNPSICIFIAVLAYLTILFVPSEYKKIFLPQLWQKIAFLLLTFGIPTIALLGRMGIFYSLNLTKYHDRGSFFQRQKDDLIKLLIGAILGGLATYLLTQITK